MSIPCWILRIDNWQLKNATKVIVSVLASFGYLSFLSCQFLGDALALEFRAFACALFEFVDSTGDIQKILLAGKERVAVRANFNMEFLFGGTRGKGVAAGTNDFGICEICWVKVFFHSQHSLT